jgi:hypothetical protein
MIRIQRTDADIAVVAAAIVILFFTGCQTLPGNITEDDDARRLITKASLPDYVPGEYFVYSDGTSVLVLAASKDQVSWKYNNGASSKGYPNFIIPDLTWTSANQSSIGRTSAPPDLLWPVQLSRRWTCTVVGAARVSVPAGQFDTVAIGCSRYSSTSGSWRATRRFYYTPEIGHYVLREDKRPGRPDTRRELVAYGFNSTMLPDQEQAELNQTLQAALTKNQDGRAAFWRSRSGNLAAMLVPFRSFINPAGNSCREYRSIYSVNGRTGQHTRNVCRQPDGQWQRVE